MAATPHAARPRRLQYFVFFAVFIVTFLVVDGTSVLIVFLLPESYASTARIDVEAEETHAAQNGGPADYNPYFFQTTFEIIQSTVVLSNVVTSLDLTERWGKKYFGGETLTPAESMAILKRHLRLNTARNTTLIEITIYSDDRVEAAELANAIAGSYQAYRATTFKYMLARGVRVLEQNLQENAREVAQLQSDLETLRKQFNLPVDDLTTGSGPAPQPTPENQPYWDKKNALAKLLDFRRVRQAKIDEEKQRLQNPPNLVEIVDSAQPGLAPVKPNKPLDLFLGALAGIFLGLAAGTLAACLVARITHSKPAPMAP